MLAEVNRMLSDGADTRRAELLEITIIALIAWEILWAFGVPEGPTPLKGPVPGAFLIFSEGGSTDQAHLTGKFVQSVLTRRSESDIRNTMFRRPGAGFATVSRRCPKEGRT